MITMTPKEKAEELVNKYLKMNDGLIEEFIPIPKEGAKQCALIAVRFAKGNPFAGGYNDYLDQVEQEINNL